MTKKILLTGATDGIGLETAKLLVAKGHSLLIHGRSEVKLSDAKAKLMQLSDKADIETFCADLSKMADVARLANEVTDRHENIDVLINNAGVFKLPNPISDTGYDIRFLVNTVAPYFLTQKLLPLLANNGRVINLSSAAQSPVSLDALAGKQMLSDSAAYAQSKLALTMWSSQLATQNNSQFPAFIAVNPGSFLGSKMVKEAYGSNGKDLSIGANILVQAALDDDFLGHTGEYFDNDRGSWSVPHPDAQNDNRSKAVVAAIKSVLANLNSQTAD